MRATLALILLIASPAVAQCPPGVTCPAPAAGSFVWAIPVGQSSPGQTSVRLTWPAGEGQHSVGSGTVIDGSAGRSIVLTAAHVVAGGTGPGKVELFRVDSTRGPRAFRRVATFEGRLVGRSKARDVALVEIAPATDLAASPLVGPTWSPSKGEELVSVGCGHGADPTLLYSKYIGPRGQPGGWDGLETTHDPAQGRSGGGLFTPEGKLCGVCDFGDAERHSGLYAPVVAVRALLVECGLERVASGDATGILRKRPPVVVESPAPVAPIVPAPPKLPAIVERIEEAALPSWLGPLLASIGIGVPLTGAGVWAATLRGKFPIVRPSPTAPELPSAEALLGLLVKRMRLDDAQKAAKVEADAKAEAEAARNAEILAKVQAILESPPPNH